MSASLAENCACNKKRAASSSLADVLTIGPGVTAAPDVEPPPHAANVAEVRAVPTHALVGGLDRSGKASGEASSTGDSIMGASVMARGLERQGLRV